MELASSKTYTTFIQERNKERNKEIKKRKEKETTLSRKDKNIKENLNLVIFIDLKFKHVTIHEYIK